MADFATKTGTGGTPIANTYDATPALTDRVPITGGRETAVQDIIDTAIALMDVDTGAMTEVLGRTGTATRTVRTLAEFATDIAADDAAMDTIHAEMQAREVEAPVELTATDIDYYQVIDNLGVASLITPAISMDAMLAAPGVPAAIGAGATVIRPETGAVAVTVQDKTREIVSVNDFGAKGDGVTDDIAAITLAIATGKNVYFPPSGVYIVSSPIICNNSYQILFGENSIIRASSTFFAVIAIPYLAKYVKLRNLRLEGAATGEGTIQRCVALNTNAGVTDWSYTFYDAFCEFDNIECSGPSDSIGANVGFAFNTVGRVKVRNSLVDRLFGVNTGYGHGLTASAVDLDIDGFKVSNLSGQGRHALYFNGIAHNIWARNLRIYGGQDNAINVRVDNTSEPLAGYNIKIRDFYINGAGAALSASGSILYMSEVAGAPANPGRYASIVNGEFIDCLENQIIIKGFPDSEIKSVVARGITESSGRHSIRILNSHRTKLSNIVIDGINTTSTVGVEIETSNDVKIDGIHAISAGSGGRAPARFSGSTPTSVGSVVKNITFEGTWLYETVEYAGATGIYSVYEVPLVGKTSAAGDTTPAVDLSTLLVSGNTSSTTITRFDRAHPNQRLIFVSSGFDTIQHAASPAANQIKTTTAANLTPAAGDSLMFVHNGTYWCQI